MIYDVDDDIAIIVKMGRWIKQTYLIIKGGFLNLLYVAGGNRLIKVRKYKISTHSIFILFYVIIK